MSKTAKPKCCGEEKDVVWVYINHNSQYWYCRQCKKEILGRKRTEETKGFELKPIEGPLVLDHDKGDYNSIQDMIDRWKIRSKDKP